MANDKGAGPVIELLTIDEVAKILRVSTATVRRLQTERFIPFLKVAGCIRFDKKDIVEYLKDARVEAIQHRRR